MLTQIRLILYLIFTLSALASWAVSSAGVLNLHSEDIQKSTTHDVDTTAFLSVNENSDSPLGTNTNRVADWITDLPFIDIFRTARHFGQTAKVTRPGVTYDQYGWPVDLDGGKALAVMLTGFKSGWAPTGNYTVLYEGEGEIRYARIGKLVKKTPGRDIVYIDAGKKGQSFSITIKKTTAGNHIRNIRVLMPGGVCSTDITTRVESESACKTGQYLAFEKYYKELIFNPEYLSYMKDFKVIRFMDMMSTNASKVTEWSDWAREGDAVWSSAMDRTGVPVEVMVKLANVVNADPWFTIPHLASNDFVNQFARVVEKSLNPGLKVYIEFSNEAWNSHFKQTKYMRKKGQSESLDHNAKKAGLNWYSKRSVEIFNIWESVFNGTDRMVRVLGSHAASTSTSKTVLQYQNAYKSADAIAIAPYLHIHDTKIMRQAANVSDIFNALKKDYQANLSTVIQQKKIADKYQLNLIAYEGGQHLVDWKTTSNDQHPNPLLYKANRDPRMGYLYTQLLGDWKKYGGQMFVQFTAPRKWKKSGSWGIKEYLSQPDDEAPKYKAVKEFIQKNPRWW